ncbi:MAG TPA: hypothetical protein VGJ62_06105 [Gemmatimonadaceae bacterium]|jgi:hypothetical protein
MTDRSPKEQLTYLLSILFAIAPFAVGLIRVFRTGNDFRYLWIAFATFFSTIAVLAIGKARSLEANAVITVSAVVLIIDTLIAAATAFLLGARAAPGVWLVALAFGLSWAAATAALASAAASR